MNIKIIEHNGTQVAQLESSNVKILDVHDALDLMGNADYQGARCVMVSEEHFSPEFFDLKTKIAGEILQKYAQYSFKLAIVGEFEKYESNALNAFILECNRGNIALHSRPGTRCGFFDNGV